MKYRLSYMQGITTIGTPSTIEAATDEDAMYMADCEAELLYQEGFRGGKVVLRGLPPREDGLKFSYSSPVKEGE